MSRGLTQDEMRARIAARDAERERRALIEADRREEFAALSEITLSSKTRWPE